MSNSHINEWVFASSIVLQTRVITEEVLWIHEPLTRYIKLLVEHAPRMPGTFSLMPQVSDSNMHHGTCVTHVPWCMLGSLTSGFLRSQWRGKHSQHSRRMRIPQFYVFGKRPMKPHDMNIPSIADPTLAHTCPWVPGFQGEEILYFECWNSQTHPPI